MKVRDVMTHPPVTCPADFALDAVTRLMSEFDCGLVLAVGDDGRLAGVVTDRDICFAAYAHHAPLHLIPLATAMITPVIAVQAGADRQSAERVMRDNRLRRLAVTDGDGRPVGVVSMDDLAREAQHERRAERDREFVDTFAAVAGPRRETGASPLVPNRVA